MAETIPAEAAPGAAAKESKGKHKAPKMELSGAQKAAAVIVALGAEKASLLYKYMEPDDVEQITLEVARLGYLDSKATEDVLTEFYQMCMTNKAVTEGGLEYARTVLEKAYGEQAAEDLLNKVTKSLKNREFAFMNKADVKSLYSALQNERPQTIALVLSYVDADKAAGVIAQLEEHKQIQVVEGIAKIESVSPTAIKIVEAEMSKKFSSIWTGPARKIFLTAFQSTTGIWRMKSGRECLCLRTSSRWMTALSSALCGTAIPGIWSCRSRHPTARWPTNSSAICPRGWRRASGTIWRLRPMSA